MFQGNIAGEGGLRRNMGLVGGGEMKEDRRREGGKLDS